MESKRQTQISIPLEFEPREIKGYVKQHWNVTFARQGKISVFAKRIMAMVLAQIRENDHQLKPYFQLRVSDVIQASEAQGKSAYQLAKKALDELAQQIWRFEDPEKEIYTPRQLINTSNVQKRDGFEYGYKDGMITVVLNPSLEPFFVELSHYTTYQLNHYMKFKSWYSMRLWEILSGFKDTGVWRVSMKDYREIMECQKKYKNVNRLITQTTSEPLQELAGTPLEFTMVQLVGSPSGRGRSKIVALEFRLVDRWEAPDEEIRKWFKSPGWTEEHSLVIRELLDKWKVSPANARKYLPLLRLDGAKALIKQFQAKEQSNRLIDDYVKYCNGALVQAAKAKGKK